MKEATPEIMRLTLDTRPRRALAAESSLDTIKPDDGVLRSDSLEEELFRLDDAELQTGWSDPEPLTSSSLSTQFDELSVLPTPARLTRRFSSNSVPRLSSPRLTPVKSLPSTPALSPALSPSSRHSPDLPSRRASADVALLRKRAVTPFEPISAPLSPVCSSTSLSDGSSSLTKVDLSFDPRSSAAPTCRRLILKLRRLSGPVNSVKIVMTLLSPPEHGRIRVHWSDGVVRDLDAGLPLETLLEEIEGGIV